MAAITTMSPYIAVKGAAEAIAFYVEAFGAAELFRLTDPQTGKIGHAELKLGDAVLMLADEYPDFGALSPASIGGSPVKLYLQVDDADAVVAQAVAKGAVLLRPMRDEFHGNRQGMIEDPFGYAWFISTPMEQVSPEVMQQRWNESTGA